MVIFLVAVGAFAAAAVAEALHARRVSRVARLAFAPTGRPRAWVRAAPIVRAAAVGALCGGLLTLHSLDGGGVRRAAHVKPDRHLVIALDVSPSMYIRDAGAGGKALRGERARELLTSVLERLDMARTRVSVVAFYTTAKPVVVDTVDLNVVSNILGDLPLEQAFKEGQTNMYSGVREAAKIAEPWPPESAALIVVSDGDTLPDALPPTMPAAFSDMLILGVGNPHRGTPIAGHTSRQDSASLEKLAARLRGVYHDGNEKHLPSTVLAGLHMLESKGEDRTPLRVIALVVTGVGAVVLAGLGPALTLAGGPRRRVGSRPAAERTGVVSRAAPRPRTIAPV